MTPRKAHAQALASLALSSLLSAPSLFAQEVETDQDDADHRLELTLDDALRIALENNLDLEVEGLSTEIARFDYVGSWGAFDPLYTLAGSVRDSEIQGASDLSGAPVLNVNTQSLSSGLAVPFTTGGQLDLTFERDNTRTNSQFAVFDTSTTDTVSVALTQPLLRGAWKRFATTDQREAEVNLRQQEARLEEVRQRVLRDVYIAYWDLAGALEELGVREVALDLGRQQLDREERRLEEGVGTEVEVLQAETNVAQLEEQRLLAEFNLRSAEDGLRTLLFQRPTEADIHTWDWPILPLTELPEAEPEPSEDWMASLNLALANRPELWQQRLEIGAAEVRLERARSNRLPGLDVTLSASSTGFDSDPAEAFETAIGYDFPTYAGTLSFDLPIGNRSARYAERGARTALRIARLVYDQTELTILSGVRQAVRDVYFASQAVAAATTSRDFAERQLSAEEARYAEGLSTTFQVLEFQRDLSEASSTLTTARAAYAKALVGLAHAEGVLDVALPLRSGAGSGEGSGEEPGGE